jgi:hypothetical protein
MAILVVTYDNTTGFFRTQQIGSAQISTGAILSSQLGSGIIGLIHFAPFTSGQVILGQGAGVPIYGFPPAGTVGDETITSAKLASGAVIGDRIAFGAILSGHIGTNILATPHIANQGILSASIASGVIGTTHIAGQSITSALIAVTQQAGIEFIIDGGGAAILSGLKGHLEIPFPATIKRVTVGCDVSGNIDLDIWKDTYANFPPTISICSGAWPHTSGNIKYQDSILSNWITAIASGDILGFVANSASSIQRCTVSLGVYK